MRPNALLVLLLPAALASCASGASSSITQADLQRAAQLAPLDTNAPGTRPWSYIDVRCAALYTHSRDLTRLNSTGNKTAEKLSSKQMALAGLATVERAKEMGVAVDDAAKWMRAELTALARAYKAWWSDVASSGGNPNEPDGLYGRDIRYCDEYPDNRVIDSND